MNLHISFMKLFVKFLCVFASNENIIGFSSKGISLLDLTFLKFILLE